MEEENMTTFIKYIYNQKRSTNDRKGVMCAFHQIFYICKFDFLFICFK